MTLPSDKVDEVYVPPPRLRGAISACENLCKQRPCSMLSTAMCSSISLAADVSVEVWRWDGQRFGQVEVTKIWFEFRVFEVERCGEILKKGRGGMTRCKRVGRWIHSQTASLLSSRELRKACLRKRNTHAKARF